MNSSLNVSELTAIIFNNSLFVSPCAPHTFNRNRAYFQLCAEHVVHSVFFFLWLLFIWPRELYFFKLPSEPRPAVPVLLGPDSNRNVSTQQQQPVSGILQESSPRVPAQRSVCVPVHRWSHAVPLHQGKRKATIHSSLGQNIGPCLYKHTNGL